MPRIANFDDQGNDCCNGSNKGDNYYSSDQDNFGTDREENIIKSNNIVYPCTERRCNDEGSARHTNTAGKDQAGQRDYSSAIIETETLIDWLKIIEASRCSL